VDIQNTEPSFQKKRFNSLQGRNLVSDKLRNKKLKTFKQYSILLRFAVDCLWQDVYKLIINAFKKNSA